MAPGPASVAASAGAASFGGASSPPPVIGACAPWQLREREDEAGSVHAPAGSQVTCRTATAGNRALARSEGVQVAHVCARCGGRMPTLKPSHPSLAGTLEYAVMVVLWDLGMATAREIHARVGEPTGLAYTTTATVLDRLNEKGCCSRLRPGKAFTYRPEMSREDVDRARARDTVSRLIADDPVPAIACLVEAIESLDPELLADLARITAARRKARDGS